MAVSRYALIQEMGTLSERKIDCRSCSGECCTSKSNSMQITASEGREILEDLRERGLLNSDMRRKIADTIALYRLDVEIPSFGKRPNLRRTYTCPLYQAGPRGCPLTPEKKPFGCLAFNAVVPSAGGLTSGCRSNQKLLLECAPEEKDKAPIPIMLLRLLVE